MSKVIGILGGMGPLATADLFEKILLNTRAIKDQDYPRILIDSNSKIPSRIEAITDGAKSPLPCLRCSAQLLEQWGANFIIIPCHTAHHWKRELQQAVNIPLHSIVDVTVFHLKKLFAHKQEKLLLWASTATVQQGFYSTALYNTGITILVPEQHEQRHIALAIDKVKSGQLGQNPHLESLRHMLDRYRAKGATSVLAGCTEVSLLFPYIEKPITMIDPSFILARKAVEWSM